MYRLSIDALGRRHPGTAPSALWGIATLSLFNTADDRVTTCKCIWHYGVRDMQSLGFTSGHWHVQSSQWALHPIGCYGIGVRHCIHWKRASAGGTGHWHRPHTQQGGLGWPLACAVITVGIMPHWVSGWQLGCIAGGHCTSCSRSYGL